jgi:hypothetical protein
MDQFERDLEQEDIFEDMIRDGTEADRAGSGDGEADGSGHGEPDGSGDGEADGSGDGEADGSGDGEADDGSGDEVLMDFYMYICIEALV